MVEDSVNEKILRQTEYYFGDINLPRDKFLQEEMKKDDGCKLFYILTILCSKLTLQQYLFRNFQGLISIQC